MKKGSEIVPEHKPKERIYTQGFEELALMLSRSMSVRDAAATMNRVLYRTEQNSVKLRTYSDYVQRQGERIEGMVNQCARTALEEAGFDCESGLPADSQALPSSVCETGSSWSDKEAVKEAVEKLGKGLEDKADELLMELENPEESCYTSVDDVLVRHQKETRKDGGEKSGAFVKNTVIEVETAEQTRILTSTEMNTAFLTLLAFLLSNHLLDHKTLIFFTDGAKDLRRNITEMFSFRQVRIILDWYHLTERCKACLSMSVKGGKDQRNQLLESLYPILWTGDVSGAVSYLRNLDQTVLRSKNRVDELCRYLEDRRDQIPCYALRHELGLRISSNHVEKANDLVVAKRQKNNGMSWSDTGSGALAQISALFLNDDIHNWVYHRQVSLFPSMAAA